VVSGVVLGPERSQPELPGRKPVRDREVRRDEQLITHQAMLAVPPPHPPGASLLTASTMCTGIRMVRAWSAIQEPATVVVFKLGTCTGKTSYTAVD
jgi:hypothetical protein